MKMTKIAFWRKVKENNGSCSFIACEDCSYGVKIGDRYFACSGEVFVCIEEAEKQIKRHEGKSRKKAANKIKNAFQSDKISIGVDLASGESKTIVQETKDPTPLDIAKMIRDNGYVCLYVWDCTRQCPISNSKTGQLDCSINRKQLIDSYIKANEPACEHLVGDLCGNAFETCNKECLANSEILKPEPVIEPIKFDDPVPEYVYTVTDFGIFQFYVLRFEREWVKRKDNTESLIEKVYAHEGKKESERVRKEVSIDIKDCYSFKDAVAVAKKNWGLE